MLRRPSCRALSARYLSSNTTILPLCQQHARFLALVGNHGDGEVSVKRLDFETPNTVSRGVVLLTLRNDRARNALSGRMMFQLAAVVDGLLHEAPAPPIGLILRGHGDAFCAGADLSLARDLLTTSERGLEMSDFMTDLLTRLRRSRMVTVALLTGPAVGGGAELATATDYRLMVDVPHCHVCFVHARLGASPGWGGAARLARIVGRAHALTLLGTSERAQPARALAIGLVDQLLSAPHSSSAFPTFQPSFSSLSSSSSTSSSSSSSSSTTTTTTTSSPSPAWTHASDDAATAAALAFLRPFAAQPYPDALGDIKEVVAAAEYCDPAEAAAWERRAFGRRWGSDANRDALIKGRRPAS